MPTQHPADFRNHPRAPVRWAARWHDGERTRTGEIRDVSRRGLFLSPAWRPSAPFGVGDRLAVCCAIDDFAVDIEAVVRWTGVSQLHGCEGLGLEVVEPGALEALVDYAA